MLLEWDRAEPSSSHRRGERHCHSSAVQGGVGGELSSASSIFLDKLIVFGP